MNLIIDKFNGIGAIASSICLIHCIATPFLFVAQACSSSCCESTPVWWQWVDYTFLVIAFFAVYQSGRMTTKKWIKRGLWLSWSALFIVILNEKMAFFSLPEYAIYFPAASLITLHLYNRKYCRCETDKCCTINESNE